ncbi:MAG: hypothetical protein QXZ22_06720 [Sulfolobales archaeon]
MSVRAARAAVISERASIVELPSLSTSFPARGGPTVSAIFDYGN